jgi:3',5'-cyclic AMP phosphodiesterase CpdA
MQADSVLKTESAFLAVLQISRGWKPPPRHGNTAIMRTLVHLSDLHFGRVEAALVEPLVEAVHSASPDLVAVSGDLTQRARTAQFIAAREFLDRLPGPQIVVPGNHDVPLRNLLARFGHPLTKYRRHISNDLAPFFVDEAIAVLGLNTARSLTIKNGRINQAQLRTLQARLGGLDASLIKILVTHHPFDLPSHHQPDDLVGRASMGMEVLARCRIDILLAGHFHVGHAGHTAERYPIAAYNALFIGAGTALSERRRGEGNSFNVLRSDGPNLALSRHAWNPGLEKFVETGAECFQRGEGGWRLAA